MPFLSGLSPSNITCFRDFFGTIILLKVKFYLGGIERNCHFQSILKDRVDGKQAEVQEGKFECLNNESLGDTKTG